MTTGIAGGPVDTRRLLAHLRATPTLLRALAQAPPDLAWRAPAPGECFATLIALATGTFYIVRAA